MSTDPDTGMDNTPSPNWITVQLINRTPIGHDGYVERYSVISGRRHLGSILHTKVPSRHKDYPLERVTALCHIPLPHMGVWRREFDTLQKALGAILDLMNEYWDTIQGRTT